MTSITFDIDSNERVPYVLGDRAASNDLAGVEDEKFQERELTRCQSDDLVVSTSLTRSEIEFEIAHRQHRGVIGSRPRRIKARKRASSSPKSNGLIR